MPQRLDRVGEIPSAVSVAASVVCPEPCEDALPGRVAGTTTRNPAALSGIAGRLRAAVEGGTGGMGGPGNRAHRLAPASDNRRSGGDQTHAYGNLHRPA